MTKLIMTKQNNGIEFYIIDVVKCCVKDFNTNFNDISVDNNISIPEYIDTIKKFASNLSMENIVDIKDNV